MIEQKRKFIGLVALAIIIVSGSCDHRRNKPGWDYFPDMFYSEAYESYTPNPNFEDGKTMQKPVEGTVPRGFVPFEYTIDPEDRIRAGEELENPFSRDKAVIDRGKEVYEAFCLNCHGSEGKGQGYLYTSGLYLALPRSLVGEVAQELKDGEIYHSITVGYGSMGPHASLVRPDDRWKVVNYIRMVLQENAKNE
ncbi:MAG: c-type cytochrome [Bacteroidales bacterium]